MLRFKTNFITTSLIPHNLMPLYPQSGLYARKIISTICAMRIRKNMASGYTVL